MSLNSCPYDIFAKFLPIFTILSPTDSADNLQQNDE